MSNHTRVTIKTPLAKKATGDHPIKSNSLERLRALSLVSARLESEYAMRESQLLTLFYDLDEARRTSENTTCVDTTI